MVPMSGQSTVYHNNVLYSFGGYVGHRRINALYRLVGVDQLVDDPYVELEWETVHYFSENPEDIPVGRAGHLLLVIDNSLYIFGGYDTDRVVLSDMFKIDLDTFKIQKIEYRNTRPIDNLDRRWFTYWVVNHTIYIHGGWNGNGVLSDLLKFDIETLLWKPVKPKGNLPPPRRWHSNIWLPKTNEVIIYGGYDGQIISDMYAYNIDREEWKQLVLTGPKPTGRCRHSLILQHDQVYLIGGYEGDEGSAYDDAFYSYSFNREDLVWEKGLYEYEFGRAGFTCQRVADSNVLLLFAGFNQQSEFNMDLVHVNFG
eukprot:TRINITY_DN2408_c0_g1_i1.p1 TRINITY_DN2408_c0_g1~~TRINITY_DN2408_c0_g1_i1.p1  ORF type:complete len:312 (-),score=66.03 TRINITY_DN2408_c0_g1_i1:23-958(-)